MAFFEKFFITYTHEKIIRFFKKICLLEAISWALLFSAMIWIRYEPHNIFAIIYISVVGSLHGLLWTLYLVLINPIRKIYKWDDEDFVFALISAFFPSATVWVDKKLAKFERE